MKSIKVDLNSKNIKITILVILLLLNLISFLSGQVWLWAISLTALVIVCVIYAIKYIIDKKLNSNEKNKNTFDNNQNIKTDNSANQNTQNVTNTYVNFNLPNNRNTENKTDISSNKFMKIKFSDFVINGEKYVVKYFYENVPIVKEQYFSHNNDLKYGDSLELIPEPNNQFDNKAVSVSVKINDELIKIGYLKKGSKICDMVNDYIVRNDPIVCKVDNSQKLTFSIAFYKIEIQNECKEYFENYVSVKPVQTINLTAKKSDVDSDVLIGLPVKFKLNNTNNLFSVCFNYSEFKTLNNLQSEFINGNKALKSFIADVNEKRDTIKITIGFYKEKNKIEI